MRHRCNGFIFMVTLCFISVISLLLLTYMQHVMIYQRASTKQEMHHQRFYQMEHLARGLSKASFNSPCRWQQDVTNGAIEQLKMHGGCLLKLGQDHYRYIIEDLGIYPCLVVEHQGIIQSTHHSRVSLLLEANEEHAASALQIRMIHPAGELSCAQEPRMVTEGVSSWRFLSLG